MFIGNYNLSFNNNKPERKWIISAMRQLTKDRPKNIEGEPEKATVNK